MEITKTSIVKWTPRLVAMAFGGYYGLGIAYETGLMALIDKIAIPILKHFTGYAGIGLIMPTFQWYAAWTVRVTIGFGFGLAYDFCETSIKYCFVRIFEKKPKAQLYSPV